LFGDQLLGSSEGGHGSSGKRLVNNFAFHDTLK